MWNRLFSLSFAKIKDNLHLSLFFRYKVTMQRVHSPMERTMGVYRQDFYRELAHRHPPSPLLSNSNITPLFAPCAVPSSSSFRVMVGRWKLFSSSTSVLLRLDEWCCYAHPHPFVCVMCLVLIVLFRVVVWQWRMVTRPTLSGLYFR